MKERKKEERYTNLKNNKNDNRAKNPSRRISLGIKTHERNLQHIHHNFFLPQSICQSFWCKRLLEAVRLVLQTFGKYKKGITVRS